VGGLGFASRAEKTRSQENACKSGRIPPVGCTLCWHAFDLQDSLPEKKRYYRRIAEIIARTFDFGKNSKTLTFEALITRRPFANQNL